MTTVLWAVAVNLALLIALIETWDYRASRNYGEVMSHHHIEPDEPDDMPGLTRLMADTHCDICGKRLRYALCERCDQP